MCKINLLLNNAEPKIRISNFKNKLYKKISDELLFSKNVSYYISTTFFNLIMFINLF